MLGKRLIMAAVAAVVVLTATPAWAHEEITPATFPTGKPTFFVFAAANENKADLVKVSLAAPSGVAFGEATREPPGWMAERSEEDVTWSGGAVKPGHFEQWGYEVEGADQPGSLNYKVTLGFADGSSEEAEVSVEAVVPDTGGSSASTQENSAKVTEPGAGARSRANTAVALALVALAFGLLATVLAVRRRPANSGLKPDAVAGDAQDW